MGSILVAKSDVPSLVPSPPSGRHQYPPGQLFQCGDRGSDHTVGGITLAPSIGVRQHGFFSLGGFLARFWHPAYVLLPWAFTSALLTVFALWDHWTRGGAIDYTVLGLAAYELMLGLMEEDAPEPLARRVREREA